MKNKKKNKKVFLNYLLGLLQYLVNKVQAHQKLVVYLDKILYFLTVPHRDYHHFLVMQTNLQTTKIKIQSFKNLAFHLGSRIKIMGKKKVKVQTNFHYFQAVQAVLKHLFSIKIIRYSQISDNRIYLSSIKLKKKMMIVIRMMMMTVNKEVKVHLHFKTIMMIKINQI